jgi:putative adenylate-forming enzyme
MEAIVSRVIDGLGLLWYYLPARRLSQFRNRLDVEKHQHAQWRRLVNRVLSKSPFYAPYAQREFRDYPLIDKQGWMKHFNDINTAHITLDEAFRIAEEAERTRNFDPMLRGTAIGMSTGTSGARGIFLATRPERLRWAATLLAKLLPEGIFAPARIALLLRAGSNLYETLSGGMRLQFQYFDLAEPFDHVLTKLEAFQPTILVGPPSVIALVSDAVISGQMRLSPTRVITAAEVLEPVDATRIANAFGLRIEQIYQATEGFLGHTCAQGIIHLNEDCLIVEREWIDRATRRFVPVITDLYRSTQPVIRYRLNDVLVEREQACPCGSPFIALEHIEGRESDIVWLPNAAGAGLAPVFPDVLSRALLDACPSVNEYHIEQCESAVLRIGVRPSLGMVEQDNVRLALVECAQRAGAAVPHIVFAAWAARPATQKCRRVRRLIDISGELHV